MSERVSQQPLPEVEEQYRAGIEQCLEEMGRFESMIGSDRARIAASRARAAGIWTDIERLRTETRSILADLLPGA